MRRLLIVLLAAAALALLPIAVAADESPGYQHFGPFAGASPDSGTCGGNWAADTFNRDFAVHQNPDGSFRVIQVFSNGRFVTVAGRSPGACQGGSNHGAVVTAGVIGRFGGYMDGTVTGATTYNPNGCDVLGACNTTLGFLVSVFGPSAKWTCRDGGGACSFFFGYYSPDPSLKYRVWINASPDLGGNRGDIATA
jgi:hypothetical protein